MYEGQQTTFEKVSETKMSQSALDLTRASEDEPGPSGFGLLHRSHDYFNEDMLAPYKTDF